MDTVIVMAMVALAVAYVVKHIWDMLRPREDDAGACGCSSCDHSQPCDHEAIRINGLDDPR